MPAKLRKSPGRELEQLIKWFDAYEDATQDCRKRALKDVEFYEGTQWTAGEVDTLQRRGQPVITINRIAPKIDFVRGTEVRTRVDPKGLPRTKAHQDDSVVATDALRYVADREDFDGIRSEVAGDLLVPGFGGCVVDIETQGKDEDESVEVKLRYVEQDRIFYDPHSRRPDFSDAKFKGIVIWLDREDAKGTYGSKEEIIEQSLSASTSTSETFEDNPKGWADAKRDRIKVCEIYYRDVKDGKDVWHVAHFTKAGFLVEPRPVAFVDEDGSTVCPLILASAYVKQENNERYGIVRRMISPQEELNKRRSKTLHLLSVRQVIAEEGAVDDPQRAQTELAKPDGYVKIRPGSQFNINTTADFAQGHIQLLQEAKQEIDATGPSPTGTNLSAGASGRARIAAQQAASLELEPVFDNLRRWQTEVFRQIWLRIRQFWTGEKWFRVRDDENKRGHRFVSINRKMTRAERVREMIDDDVPLPSALENAGFRNGVELVKQIAQQFQPLVEQGVPPEQVKEQVIEALLQQPLMQELITANDIAKLGMDIVLDAAPDTAVIEQEEFEQLAQLAQTGIQIPPDVLIEASQLRNKKKLLEMLKTSNAPDPQAQQLQQQLSELGLAQSQANVQKTQADAQEKAARAQKHQAETGNAGAKAQKDQALAMKHAAEAGSKAGDLQTIVGDAA